MSQAPITGELRKCATMPAKHEGNRRTPRKDGRWKVRTRRLYCCILHEPRRCPRPPDLALRNLRYYVSKALGNQKQATGDRRWNHSTRRLLYHTLFELRCFPSPPIGQCGGCVTPPTKPFGKQTQATERRALDSTAHVDSTVVYCMSRVDVPGTHIWRCASCATMPAKHVGNRRRPRRRRALDSTAHVASTVVYCMSRVDVPGTHIWHCASCATMQQSTWEPDAGHEETGVGQHSTRRLLCHTLFELRCFPSPPIGHCASCVATPTKPFGKQTQATERRALDSTAHVDSTVVYCMSRVDVPGTHIWRCASCATMPAKHLGNRRRPRKNRRWIVQHTSASTVVYCVSRVDVPGTHIWHCASCATVSAKHLGTRRTPRGDGRWTSQHTQTSLSHLVRAALLSRSANRAISCVATPTKPFGKQTQATERRALDSTAHVDSTVVYCMSRVDVPSTHIWRCASCATMPAKRLGNRRRPRKDGRWIVQLT